MAGQLTDAFAAVGSGYGWSFPRPVPLWRIDYAWLSSDVKPLNCRTLAVGPSDHYPVVVDVAIRR
jgi:endonuclease/exonuclease/phosphatase family metal-dependent hydrolase